MKCIEDEIPFEVPEGWGLCRLNDVISLMTDYVANGSFKTLRENVTTYKEPNYALFIRTVDFSNDFKGDLSYIDKESYEFLSKSQLHGGELMLSNIGASIGKIFRIPHFDMPMSLAPNSIIVKFHDEETYDYFECMFKSFVGQDFLLKLTAGTAMPKFSKTELKQMVVPIAPLKEQVRISNECKKLLSVVDSMESNKEDLAEIIALAKSKILDLAIQGKLVPQDSNDEPASVLLDRIRSEKEELIKQGKLKRDKKESIIYKGDDNSYYEQIGSEIRNISDEIPFDIPEAWEWCRLGVIGNWQSGATPSRKHPEYYDGNIPWLKTGDLNDDFIKNIPEYITEDGMRNSSAVLNPIGSVLIAMYGATIGKLGILTIEATTNQACCACLPILINNEYLFYYLMQHKAEFISSAVGGAQPNISKEKIVSTLFPVPPLAEQLRIVEEIKKLFNLISSIDFCLSS